MKKTKTKKKATTKKSIAKKSITATKKAKGKSTASKGKKPSSVMQKAKKVLGDVVKGALSGAATGAIDATAKAAGLPKEQESKEQKITKMPKKKK